MGKHQRRKNTRRQRTGPWKAQGKEAHDMGRALEHEVDRVLAEMVSEGVIDGHRYHLPSSKEDHEGKDFTVERGDETRSFGVSTSHKRAIKSEARHARRVLHVSKDAEVHERVAAFVSHLFTEEQAA